MGKIKKSSFTILDWIGIVYVVQHTLALFLFPKVAVTFGQMFAEFGRTIPFLTILVLKPWFSISLGLVSLAIFSLLLHKSIKESLPRKRTVVVFSFVFASTALAICVIAIYQPIFRIAGPAF